MVISCNKHWAQFLAHLKGVSLIKSRLSRDPHPLPRAVAHRKQASDSSQTLQGSVNDSLHAPSLKISMLVTSVQYQFASDKLWHVGLLGSYLLNFEHHCFLTYKTQYAPSVNMFTPYNVKQKDCRQMIKNKHFWTLRKKNAIQHILIIIL